MSTIVCQNLVSCFDSNLTEATATLKLKVAAPPTAALDHRNNKSGSWGFFQTDKYSEDKDNYYTTKNTSFSKLSPKSLELCTENLGSETGVDNISDCSSIFSSSPPFSLTSGEDLITARKTIEVDDWIQKPRSPYHREVGPTRKATNFPPPLTSSNSGLQVRHHREGGRLIIEAVEAPFRNTYLQAERSDGRLKLCFFTTFDEPETTETAESIAGEEEEEEKEEEENEEEEEEEEECAADEEIEEAGELEVGVEKYHQRLSRCKEGSHGNKGGLCSNWKTALWVATS